MNVKDVGAVDGDDVLMSKTLHVVFKTHLDVGSTDFAAAVKQRYFDHYIPQALRVARQLRNAGGPDRFVWTTGSWIIDEYLEQADRAARKEAEEGIRAGDLRWHGLPFTTHSELMDPDLFRFGCGLSRELDRRFGMRTIAAKMTDVPGHTRGIVALMAEAGLRFLHIGVNQASRAPSVPVIFRWREPESGAERLTTAEHSDFHRFSRELLLVAEHTWGMDAKTHLADYRNYSRADFTRARSIDIVFQDNPPPLSFAEGYRLHGLPQTYRKIEASWSEQRAYLHRAVESIPGLPLITADWEWILRTPSRPCTHRES